MTDEQRFEALDEKVVELLRRQHAMEERLARLEGTPAAAPAKASETRTAEPVRHESAESPAAASVPDAAAAASAIHIAGDERTETPRSGKPAMETKVGLTLVNRIGVVTLILGVGFFFKWAVDNNWIGPAGRVILGLAAGFAAMGAADYLWRKKQQTFAQGVAGAGVAILYLSAYAAFSFYHLVPQFIAFAFMVGTTALGFALALRYEAAAIAVLGLLGGYSTPFLLSTGEDHPWFLLSYVLLLDVAAMALVKRKQWRPLEMLAFAATTFIYIGWFQKAPLQHEFTVAAALAPLAYYLLFAYSASNFIAAAANLVAALEMTQVWDKQAGPFFAFELLIAGMGMFAAMRRRFPIGLSVAFVSFWACFGLFYSSEAGMVGAQFAGITIAFICFLLFRVVNDLYWSEGVSDSTSSLSILAANGSVYYGFAYLLLRNSYHDLLGLLAVCVAGTYVGFAALLRRHGQTQITTRPLLVAIGMALAFLTLAIPIQLTGFHITVGWAIQAAALTWIGTRLKARRAIFAGAFIFLLVAFRLAFDGWLDQSDLYPVRLLLNERFATFAVVAVCGFFAARWATVFDRRLALSEYLGAHVVLLAGLTFEALLWAGEGTAPTNLLSAETVSVSILYGIYALALVSIGVASRTAVNRIAGLALVGFVIVKLYLFDVWQIGHVYRIAAFVALGLLLISTSFLYSRFRNIIEALLRNNETGS